MKPFRLVLALSLASALVAACSGGSSSSGASADDDDDGATAYALTNGTYDFVVDQEIADTCWVPPKTMPELPMTVTGEFVVNGNQVTITINDPNIGTQVLEVEKNGNDLTGGGSGQADTGIGGCILDISGAFDGVMTADDAFDAVIELDIAVNAGDCSALIGDFLNEQLSALPCHLELGGVGTKI